MDQLYTVSEDNIKLNSDSSIAKDKLPKHVAVIMDGNGRWANKKGLDRVEGHKKGADSVRTLVTNCRQIGIPYLTLYAFSEENWERPKSEVSALMVLFEQFLRSEYELMCEKGVVLKIIGAKEKLPQNIQELIKDCEEGTKVTASKFNGNTLNLNLAISYGGRQEIVRACKNIADKYKSNEISLSEIDSSLFSEELYTSNMPDPDLLIRTSSEKRVSNFLLWQIAYAEIYITDKLWPEFDTQELLSALVDYSKRTRKFGRVI